MLNETQKLRVVCRSIRSERTVGQVASESGVSSDELLEWRRKCYQASYDALRISDEEPSFLDQTLFLLLRLFRVKLRQEEVANRQVDRKPGVRVLEFTERSSSKEKLAFAKDIADCVTSRLSMSTDKAKTLLTIAGLLAAILGLLLTRVEKPFDSWQGIVLFCSIAAAVVFFIITIYLLLEFFNSSYWYWPDISRADLSVDDIELKRANDYLEMVEENDRFIEFLLKIYSTARYSFVLALFCCCVSLAFGPFYNKPTSGVENAVNKIAEECTRPK